MHGKRGVLSQIFFGRDAEYLYLRTDFHHLDQENPERLEMRIIVRGTGVPTVVVRFRRAEGVSGWQCDVRSDKEVSGALGDARLRKVFEVRLGLAALGLRAEQALEFQCALWQDNLPVETLPLEGWLGVP
jgi:hypothetical protein